MSDWQLVQDLFSAAVALPPEERREFLLENCGSNPKLLEEIESLLVADQNQVSIEAAVQDVAVSFLDAETLVGQRLGIYRIIREIGRGGMGSVYLASRDDQEYRREVALKIVKRGMDTSEVLERFRYERQILANLDHPYIARLFDGGSTADGVPFFVMEYVQGIPVNIFCRQHSLDYAGRCQLFIRILEAVSYAHRNLVVHRDLKPANILITPDGNPKLLDFGVAKLLGSGPDSNRTGVSALRSYTPAYASPEQVRGSPITTASDIYSLGAILFEILSGRPAVEIEVHTPAEIERLVCETAVRRPSFTAHDLSSDLDNIVLMALRKEPDRRYQSADQFAEDLRRHLGGRPVIARQTSIAYRARKFVLRNRWQVAGATIIALSLISGLVTSIAQTRRAETAQRIAESQRLVAIHQESLANAARIAASLQKGLADRQSVLAREQRDRAELQKAIADQRVKDIFELADHALFDVHDVIAALPGSVAARRTLVQTTLGYLQKLETQLGLDDQMRQALCAGYYKVAMIQGDPQNASLQDFEASEKSLRKGESLLIPAYNRNPNDPSLMMRLVEIRSSLAQLIYRSGRREEGIGVYIDLLPVAHRLFLARDCTLNCKTQEPVIENSLTTELASIDPARALEYANRGIALERILIAQNPGDDYLEQGLGSLMAGGAGAYRSLGELQKSADYYRQSIAIRENLLKRDPSSPSIRRSLMIVYGNYEMLLGGPQGANLEKPAEAHSYGEKSVALARLEVASDANDATARHDLSTSLSRLGALEPEPDGIQDSFAQLEEARRLLEPIVLANPKSSESANQLAFVLEHEGHRLETLGRNPEALAAYRKSMETINGFLSSKNSPTNSQYLSDEENIALLDAVMGDNVAALQLAKQALERAQQLGGEASRTVEQNIMLANAWSTLAIVQDRGGVFDQAKESARKAIFLWDMIQKPSLLVPFRRMIVRTRTLLPSQ